MYVIKLPNGNLLAPESATDHTGQVIGDAYVEVSPSDPDYQRLAQEAVPAEEVQERRRRWRDGDDALRRQFEQYRASREQAGTGGTP